MSTVFSVKLPYKVRCSLPDCGKPVNLVFKTELDGTMCTFCSPYHSRLGEDRWKEKIDKNIRLGVPPKEPDEEYIGDSLGDEVIKNE